MLRIFQSDSAQRAKNYYTSGLEDAHAYYEAGASTSGLWFGKAAKRLKLTGEVSQKHFNLLCDNRKPEALEKLNPRENQKRKIGYDITFSAPKSISLLQGVVADTRVTSVFQQAVRETMKYIESEVHVRVRKGGVVATRKTSELVWAEFTHFESRPIDGISDANLHCHCYCFNTSYDRAEERFKAAEFYSIVKEASFYQAIFHSRLAELVKGLGYSIENQPFSFEVAGVGEKNIARFSRRSKEILDLSESLGIAGDAKKMDKLASLTRKSKKQRLKGAEQFAEWRSRFDWTELDLEKPSPKQQEITAEEAVKLAIENEFERKSVSSLRRVIANALQISLGSCTLEEITSAIRSNDELIAKEVDGVTYATTKEILNEEKSILSFLERSRSTQIPMLGWYREKSDELDADQRSAIEAIMKTRDQAIFVSGRAGSGKTKMLTRLVEKMAEVGVKAHLFAPSSAAAHGVLKSEGFGDSETVQQLLVNPKLQEEIQGKALIIDEAGLLGTKDFKKLFEIAEQQNARVICLGDSAQHHSVQRGSGFRLCCESGFVTIKETRSIYRQRNAQYKKAVTALSLGDAEEALTILDEMEAIKEVSGFEERLEMAAQEYVQSLDEYDGSVLAVSPTHLEGRLLTDTIRSQMREQGLLEKEETAITVHRARNLTEAEQKLVQFYRVGDVVRFHQNTKGGFTKSDIAKVVEKKRGGVFVQKIGEEEIRRLDLSSASHFSVFNENSISVSVGDRVRLTRNAKLKSGRRLFNGNIHTITEISKDGFVTLDEKHRVNSDIGMLDFGFVSSSHASQGKTTNKVIICQSSLSFEASSLEQFYVSVSRGRDAVTIFTDSKSDLLGAVSDPSNRMLAIELEKEAREEEELEPVVQQQMSNEVELLR